MKLIVLAYLLLVLCSRNLGIGLARLAHALRLWRWCHRPWRVAWDIASRRRP